MTEDGDISGDHPVTPLYRWCNAFRTLAGARWCINDEAILACSSRSPRDLVSEKRLTQFNARKMDQGAARSLDYLVPPIVDTRADLVEKLALVPWVCVPLYIRPGSGVPSTEQGTLYVLSAGPNPLWDTTDVPETADVRHPNAKLPKRIAQRVRAPHFLVLPEEGFQPPDFLYDDQVLGCPGHTLNEPSTGRAILRMRLDDPEYTTDHDAETWPAFRSGGGGQILAMGLRRNADACAKALREGKHVWIVGERPKAQCAFFAAVVLHHVSLLEKREACLPDSSAMSGLDCLEEVFTAWATYYPGTGGPPAENFTFRTYLHNLKGA